MKISKLYWLLITKIFYKMKFKKVGNNSIIIKPIQLDETNSISIGDNVRICYGSWLMGNCDCDKTFEICNNVCIGHYAHIVARNHVSIKENALIADKVFITDCTHTYEDINIPIKDQEIIIYKNVSIGEDSWIGENVSILGASIGKHSVIGANSVVIDDIPDYCVAVGSPAKVVKKYNFETNKWIKL